MKIEHFKMVSRFDDWRFSFIPQIFGLLYFWLLIFKYELNFEILKLLGLSFITSVGFASIGYLINEFFDQKSDALVGKKNQLKNASIAQKLTYFFISLSLTFIPWLLLPSNTLTWVLISLQLAVYFLYNAPPFRLKNHPFFSILLDASYAYLIPFILSGNTYYLGAKTIKIHLGVFILFASILFLVGLRNIFLHLIDDYFFDNQNGRISLPKILGVNKSKLLLITIFSLEFILLISVSILLSSYYRLFLILLFIALFYLFGIFIRIKKDDKYFILDSSFCSKSNAIYQIYFPLICLSTLCLEAPLWSILVPIHLLTLIPKSYILRLKGLLKFIFKEIVSKGIRNMMSKIVNYSIYYLFLIVGVNLKKEQKSALEFLRKQK